MAKEELPVRQSLQGLNAVQLKEILRRHDRNARMKDDAAAVFLPEYDDPNAELLTEIHPLGMISKIHMRFMERVYDTDRPETLLEAWNRCEDRSMMALKRQRVWELMRVKISGNISDEDKEMQK
jgi:hypothetical protein